MPMTCSVIDTPVARKAIGSAKQESEERNARKANKPMSAAHGRRDGDRDDKTHPDACDMQSHRGAKKHASPNKKPRQRKPGLVHGEERGAHGQRECAS